MYDANVNGITLILLLKMADPRISILMVVDTIILVVNISFPFSYLCASKLTMSNVDLRGLETFAQPHPPNSILS